MNDKKSHFSVVKKALQNIRLLLLNEDFSKDVKKIKQENLKSMLLAKTKEEKLKNCFIYGEKVEKLIVKYNLSSPHFIPLNWYILFNDKEQIKIEEMFNKYRYEVKTDDFGGQTIFIPIFPETTIEDLREILPVIKKAYGKPSHKRMKRISLTNLEIADMKKIGYTNEEIKNNIKVGVDSKKIIDKSDIPKTINKLKKRSKIK